MNKWDSAVNCFRWEKWALATTSYSDIGSGVKSPADPLETHHTYSLLQESDGMLQLLYVLLSLSNSRQYNFWQDRGAISRL
jgi:hypothetical protein